MTLKMLILLHPPPPLSDWKPLCLKMLQFPPHKAIGASTPFCRRFPSLLLTPRPIIRMKSYLNTDGGVLTRG